MKEATLNPQIATMDTSSMEYSLYIGIVDMINRANSVDAPDFTASPPIKKDENGNPIQDPDAPTYLIDTDLIKHKLDEYRDIQTKNYAFDMAKTFMGVMTGSGGSGGTGGTGGTGGFLPLTGGTLSGAFVANFGVELGHNGTTMIRLVHDNNNKPLGYFDLSMAIVGDVSIDGALTLADAGITFNKHQTIFVDAANSCLNIDYQNIKIKGATEIDGIVTIGDVVITPTTGITFQGHEYYHAGNANKNDVDWAAKDMHVYGDLTVDGDATLSGRLSALHGFDLGESGAKYFYSSYNNSKCDLWVGTDMSWLGYDHGIKFDGKYVLVIRSTDTNALSFGAPGRVMYLGDSDTDATGAKIDTLSIALHTKFNTGDNAVTLITPEGTGYFLGLTAASTSAGSVVLKTYRNDSIDEGVIFPKFIALKSDGGPKLYADTELEAKFKIPYLNTDGSKTPYEWSTKFIETDSLFRDLQLSTPTLLFNTTGQFFRFDKPVESEFFSIISQKTKTSLEEGCLFLNKNGSENLFLQAIPGGIFHSGNATFNHSLSSQIFTSGFAGSGWAILEDALTGNFGATFDELTIRKKMRIYELEVQKMNVTNGSWWVTDSCAGDKVEEII